MKKEILIYNDEGSGTSSIKQLQNFLSHFLGQIYVIKSINSHYILNYEWQTSCKIICFGGGYDLGYLKKLGIKGCQLIRQFIYSGGIYIGICAGAYFACKDVEFDKNGPLEVLGKRYIRLFQGSACGPILSGFDYNSRKGIHACEIYCNKIEMSTEKLLVMYEGGCAFKSELQFKDTTILYKYGINDEPAIIHSKCGKGQALLSGVHFEFNVNDIDFELVPCTREKLEKFEEARHELAENLFKYMNIK